MISKQYFSGEELILPNFLVTAISCKELNFDVPGKSKLKTSFFDVLFDVIQSRHGLYPSSSQLYQLAHEVMLCFPNVKPTHGNGSEFLVHAFKEKLNQVRQPLVINGI
ncbi:uncharacterized protein LOC136084795 isoform X2 [Hydra vulgaris]|uniref:Uncharacterized protein LOC136084795 isoform X2 n=1 Tax=Hydra vulgaris TaxID=6087 RepID=A0ABM4CJ85_HYDVU